jgi:hypothetical protein
VVSTIAGGGACNRAGYKDGLASEALFNLPARVQAVTMHAGDSKTASIERLFVLDNHNGCIRSFPLGLPPAETIVRSDTGCGVNSTLAFLGPDAKFANGTSRNWRWVDGPLDFWVSADTRTVWVIDTYNNKLKAATKNSPADAEYGPWKTIAGSGALGTNDGDAASATFFQPHGLAVAESTGFAYVSDTFSSCIRSISLSTGKVMTIAGIVSLPMKMLLLTHPLHALSPTALSQAHVARGGIATRVMAARRSMHDSIMSTRSLWTHATKASCTCRTLNAPMTGRCT